MGRDNLVGIASRYGLDGPGIESRFGARFSAHVPLPALGPKYNVYRVILGGKAAGAWR